MSFHGDKMKSLANKDMLVSPQCWFNPYPRIPAFPFSLPQKNAPKGNFTAPLLHGQAFLSDSELRSNLAGKCTSSSPFALHEDPYLVTMRQEQHLANAINCQYWPNYEHPSKFNKDVLATFRDLSFIDPKHLKTDVNAHGTKVIGICPKDGKNCALNKSQSLSPDAFRGTSNIQDFFNCTLPCLKKSPPAFDPRALNALAPACCAEKCCVEGHLPPHNLHPALLPAWFKLGNMMLANHILNTQYIQAMCQSEKACGDFGKFISPPVRGTVDSNPVSSTRKHLSTPPATTHLSGKPRSSVTNEEPGKSSPAVASPFAWSPLLNFSFDQTPTSPQSKYFFSKNPDFPGKDKFAKQRDEPDTNTLPYGGVAKQTKAFDMSRFSQKSPKLLHKVPISPVTLNCMTDNSFSSVPDQCTAGLGYEQDRCEVNAKNQAVVSKSHHQTNSLKEKRSHRCFYCGKLYSRKYGLKIHIRTHTGYKPLKCKICGRPFGDPSNLNKHVRLHAEGETPYRCPFCGKVLVRRRDLERHVSSRHPERKATFLIKSEIECPPADPRLWAAK